MGDRSSRPHRLAEPDPAPGGPQDRAPALEAAAGPGRRSATRLGDAGLDGARGAGAVPAEPALPTSTGPPVSRSAATSTTTPASLLHVDVKKLGNIPDGGGWRYVGRAAGQTGTGPPPRASRAARHHNPQDRAPRSCTPCIDDHSRVAYAEIHDDETAATATAVLRRAVAWFADRGVTVERVLSDNGSAYRVPPVARHLRRARHHRQADPALPATDQRQDRTLPPHPGRRLGVQDGSTPPRPPAAQPCQHGSTSTTTTGPTPRSARPHPSPA